MSKNISILIACAIVVVLAYSYYSNKDNDNLVLQNSITNTQDASSGSQVNTTTNVANQTGSSTLQNSNSNTDKKAMNVTLTTNKGNITIELFVEKAPNTVANFKKLADAGFYNGVKFHRVIKGFMIQSGDPLSKDDAKSDMWGTGGPGYKFADEIHADNRNDVGTIAMANAGPNTNGSQFFINVNPNNFLDGKHTVFGKVIKGMDVVTEIEGVATNQSDQPLSPVVVEKITF
jgi:cyclophilin family peptidyl-prolyl cis-trans isomerase